MDEIGGKCCFMGASLRGFLCVNRWLQRSNITIKRSPPEGHADAVRPPRSLRGPWGLLSGAGRRAPCPEQCARGYRQADADSSKDERRIGRRKGKSERERMREESNRTDRQTNVIKRQQKKDSLTQLRLIAIALSLDLMSHFLASVSCPSMAAPGAGPPPGPRSAFALVPFRPLLSSLPSSTATALTRC